MRARIFSLVLFATLTLPIAVSAQQRPDFYTGPYHEIQKDTGNWIFLIVTPYSRFEFDKNSISWIDSTHFQVRMKDSPLALYACDARRAKSWQQNKNEEGDYTDSLRLHPLFNYEGFDSYGFTIFDEVIDPSSMHYAIVHVMECSVHNQVLSDYTVPEQYWVKIASPTDPELVLIRYIQVKSRESANR